MYIFKVRSKKERKQLIAVVSFTEKTRDELRDQVYDAMAEKDKVEEKQSEEKEMSVDGENVGAGEDKCDAVKEENKSEDDREPEKEDKAENKEAGKELDQEEEEAEGDDCYSPLKL